jgi:hypothetical protein
MNAIAIVVAGGIVVRNRVKTGVSYACPLTAILTEYKADLLGT